MPRYIVQRTFPNGFQIPIDNAGADTLRAMVRRNGELGVTWIHSYVSDDKTAAFCVCDAPTPDAIRASAAANQLPVGQITPVSVLDPYFYR